MSSWLKLVMSWVTVVQTLDVHILFSSQGEWQQPKNEVLCLGESFQAYVCPGVLTSMVPCRKIVVTNHLISALKNMLVHAML